MKKSPAYIATEKLLIAIRDHKPIVGAAVLKDQRAVTRLIGYCGNNTIVPAVKEVRALAECGLREAVDLYKRYFP